MKNYLTATQEAYDELMSELEEKGYKWLSGREPTAFNYWEQNKGNTCINISSKYITFMNIEQSKKQHPDIPIIEYKAKGENMTQEEMKQNIIDWATDVFVAVGLFARDIKFEMKKSTVEADLQEAKSSAKKLIEKIGEYLETLEPKFKVGDYATVEASGRKIIAKIDKLTENKTAFGLWYDEPKNIVKQDFWFLTEGNIFSHSTPEEIAEYEVALTFHKHGRKPFEVKEGDLIKYPNGQNIMIYYPEVFSKADFLNDGFKLIKTAEEVNEWLENK